MCTSAVRVASKKEVDDELRKILKSKTFSSSPQSKRFLEFVVTKSLSDEAALKGSIIAIEVFGKTGEFDPRASSVVRTGANRLRRLLKTYYQLEGFSDQLLISLPEGRYIPQFTRGTCFLP